MTNVTLTPRQHYESRRDHFAALEEALSKKEEQLGTYRLLVALAAGILWWLTYANGWSLLWLLLPLAAFIVLISIHMNVSNTARRASRGRAMYERGLERLDGAWHGHSPDGASFKDSHHLYAPDLDLFGKGSLFQRLCTARLRAGQERLAAWLKQRAEPNEITRRQAAVLDLATRHTLREDAALVGDDMKRAGRSQSLRSWLTDDSTIPGRGLRPVLVLSSLVTTAALVGWLMSLINPLWFFGAALIQYALTRPLSKSVEKTLANTMGPAQELALLGRLLERLRAEDFDAPMLGELSETRAGEHGTPSEILKGIERRRAYVESRANPLFMVIAWLGCLGTHLGFGIESWRKAHGETVLHWVEHCARYEALASLATWSFERPQAAMPTLDPQSIALTATELGHPLLHPDACVTNDVSLARDQDDVPTGLIVSGSNMSGKSTMLRTVGTNVVLAQAGAPVVASSMTLSPLRVAASITVQDSLMKGASRFYAEIERLKQVVDASRESPTCLFLIDEVLHGTNSHDRRVGTRGIVRSLLSHGAMGLITTHDLALSDLATESGGRLKNVHFVDHVEDGRIAFDYILRDGRVTRSNALALMRSVGIDVEETLEDAQERLTEDFASE